MRNPAKSVIAADTLNANMPIYTRTGDDGTTALFGGKRILKCDELVDVYGSIDELNSWLGLVISRLGETKEKDVAPFLTTLQEDLFTIGGSFAGWKGDLSGFPTRISDMEKHIDEWEKTLPMLTNFILPGGHPVASLCHIARSICRRVERQTVALGKNQEVDSRIIMYLNRLSDLFFQFARVINKNEQIGEVTWSGIPRTKNK